MAVDVPVLLTAFCRPQLTDRVLERLAQCGIRKLFVHVDGSTESTKQQVSAVRSVIEKWRPKFELTLRVNERNLGCRVAMEQALSWYFDQVDEGIVLEDDCLPEPSFFPFCAAMLAHYRNDDSIAMIGGHLPLGEWQNGSDHALTATMQIWGWATWRTVWQQHQTEIGRFTAIDAEVFRNVLGNTQHASELYQQTKKSLNGELNTWDYLFQYSHFKTGKLCVQSTQNHVINLGFGPDATHTPVEPDWHKQLINIHLPESSLANIQTTGRDRALEFAIYNTVRGFMGVDSSKPSLYYGRLGELSNRKLNIVQVNTTDRGGGAERIMMDLHEAYQKAGHNSKVLVSIKQSDDPSVIELSRSSTLPFFGKSKPDLAKSLQRLGFLPDVIHLHNLHGTNIDLNQLAMWSLQNPMLWTLHDQWTVSALDQHPFQFRPEGLSDLKRADKHKAISQGAFRFVAPSIWLAEQFARSYNLTVNWVGNGVDTTVFQPNPSMEKNGLLFVANRPEQNPYKDFETLVTAWKMLNAPGAISIDLTCVGGPERTEMHGAGTLRILPFEHNQAAMAEHYQRCKVYVHASLNDNMPLSLLEAMACGASCIAAFVGGIPEVSGAQNQLSFYRAGDVNSLLEALQLALNQPENGFKTHMFDVTDMANTYLGHYAEMIGDA